MMQKSEYLLDSDEMLPFSEIDRTFKQFVFETMELSTVDDEGRIVAPDRNVQGEKICIIVEIT